MVPQLRRAARADRGERAVLRSFAGNLSADWTSLTGAGAIRFFVAFAINVVALGSRRACAWWRPMNIPSCSKAREPRAGTHRRGQSGRKARHILLGAFCTAGELCAVPHGPRCFRYPGCSCSPRKARCASSSSRWSAPWSAVAAIIASGNDRGTGSGRKPLLIGSAIAIAVYSGFGPAAARCRPRSAKTVYMVLGLSCCSACRSASRRARSPRASRPIIAITGVRADLGFRLGCSVPASHRWRRCCWQTHFGADLGRRISFCQARVWTLVALWLSGPARSRSRLTKQSVDAEGIAEGPTM